MSTAAWQKKVKRAAEKRYAADNGYRGPYPSTDPRTGCVAPKSTEKKIELCDAATYDIMMQTARGEVRIGHAFEVSNGEIVIELSAMPMSGQARLRRTM